MHHPKYRADIDGLRAIAVMLVVAFHAFPKLVPGGFIGVDIFFVISGFLISTILFESHARGQFSYRQFYERRIRRIFPALLIVLWVCLIAGWFLQIADDYGQQGKHTAAGAAFVANLSLWHDVNYFEPGSYLKPLLHLWSLGIEEQFYILWPAIIGLWAYIGLKSTLPGIIIFSASLAACLVLTFQDPTAAYYAPWSRFWELAAGGLLAYLSLNHPQLLTRGKNLQAIVGLLLIGVTLAVTEKSSPFPGWRAILPVAAAFLLISAGPTAWVNRHLLARRVMVTIGLISYPLYLWHWPLLSFAYIVEGDDKISRTVRITAVVLSVLLAWLTYRFLEIPLKKTSRPGRQSLVLLGLMVMTLVAGLLVYLNEGIAERAINQRADKVLLHTYRKFRVDEFGPLNHTECDFYNHSTGRGRDAIDVSCTRKGEVGTYFLWGDSHALHLSYGLRQHLPPGIALAQVVTAGSCHPAINPNDGHDKATTLCNRANAYARAQIERLKPQWVIVAQMSGHLKTDWNEITAFVTENGGRVLLVGPLPRWQPSLPEIVAKGYMDDASVYINAGLTPDLRATDAGLSELYTPQKAHKKGLYYVSVIKNLCRGDTCMARVPSPDDRDLFSFDSSHLMPAASDLIAQQMLYPAINAAP